MYSLKLLRIIFASLFFVAISVFFVDFTSGVPRALHGLAHLQLTPTILIGTFGVLGAGVFVFWFVTTLLFGRVYCSVICPFGILQDIVSWIAKHVTKKKKYKYQKETTHIRYSFLILFVFGLCFLPVIVSILDPYSNYGRVMNSLARPVVIYGNNLIAGFTASWEKPLAYNVAISFDFGAFLTAAAAFVIVGVFSFFFGRRYCNTICPVGTLLGLVSRFSFVKVRLLHNCRSCGLCERVCKSECINSKAKTVDTSRCVACMNCLSQCRSNAISLSYQPHHKQPPLFQPKDGLPGTSPKQHTHEPHQNPAFEPLSLLPGAIPIPVPVNGTVQQTANRTTEVGTQRRRFVKWSIFTFLAALFAKKTVTAAEDAIVDESLPHGESRVSYTMNTPVLPPGAKNVERFRKRCTACHLCVTKCPTGIITPSTTELGLAGFLQPILKFRRGFCDYECKICTEVCPSLALTPLETLMDKKVVQMGRVVFLKENCVVNTQGTNCGACAEHCPTGAVAMVPYGEPEKALTIPVTKPELCIGCGGCEFICPVRPYRAIYVEGLEVHQTAELGYDPNAKQEEVKVDDFGF
ncbi:MAG: 4Fe-4S binding protein [Planctomycetaceae bacterium]|jgi:ferredoxin|nr:4Fe-4S binding protein [Planctomycetaceae bacterium]